MGKSFAQYESDNPILMDVPIKSRAESAEMAAKVLGGVANVAAKGAESLANEASASHLLQAQSMITEASNSAKIQMMYHPDLIDKIFEKHNAMIDEIKNNATVNQKHRNELNGIAVKAYQSLKMHRHIANFHSFM